MSNNLHTKERNKVKRVGKAWSPHRGRYKAKSSFQERSLHLITARIIHATREMRAIQTRKKNLDYEMQFCLISREIQENKIKI